MAPANLNRTAEWSTLGQTLRRHSLFWFVAANSVGVLLAAELLWPPLGDSLAPFTYGRWIPLHLNWQLYGWCSLPLVGLLVRWIGAGPNQHSAPIITIALWSWSFALLAGGISWLAGITSGKLFLDWYGWARPLLPAAMTLLWGALVWQLWANRTTLTAKQRAAQIAFLLAMFAVPPAIFWASGRNVYPAVNPHSGGATGASLLGSTLGIVGIFGLLPEMLGVANRARNATTYKRVFWILFFLSIVAFTSLDHTNASSSSTGQQVGLGVLLLWIPVAWLYFLAFEWNTSSRPWLAAAFAWWLLLVCTGFLIFLPAFSERLKFTNALVSHAHLAMAGLITSMNLAILNLLTPERPIVRGFWIWQLATALQVVTLAVLGWLEADRPGALFSSDNWTQELYALRLASGLIMLIVSVTWFTNCRQSTRRVT